MFRPEMFHGNPRGFARRSRATACERLQWRRGEPFHVDGTGPEQTAERMSEMNEPSHSLSPNILRDLPPHPGVYLMKGEGGTVLYVGKAKNLRSRVASYFREAGPERGPRIRILVSRVREVETILTGSEKEALILENTLIKKHHPKFNVNLRDDKNYLYLRIHPSEPFARLLLVRKVKKDGAFYFGPYTSAKGVRETWRLMHRHFRLRRCRPDRKASRPCFHYQIGACSCGDVRDPLEYRHVISEVKQFLEGRDQSLLRTLKERMEQASERLEFEAAARIRDQIRYVEGVLERQKMVTLDFEDRDIVGWRQDEPSTAAVLVLFVRGGRLLGRKGFFLDRIDLSPSETLSAFLVQFYGEEKLIPKEVLLSFETVDRGILEDVLSERRGNRVRLSVPKRGAKRALVEMADTNAAAFLDERRRTLHPVEQVLEEAQRRLGLKRPPRVMECVDISNLQGRHAVGSTVRFRDGEPDTAGYRRYRIRTVEGMDDYGMMYEVLKRRFAKDKADWDLPDLLVLDGGKGQLNVALRVLNEAGIEDMDLAAMAKTRRNKGKNSEQERFFRPHVKDPVRIPVASPLLALFVRLRDEAHRFAIEYHRRLKRTRDLHSFLLEIPGIGPETAKRLLNRFGSLEAIREATAEALSDVMDRRKVEFLKSFLVDASQSEALRKPEPEDALSAESRELVSKPPPAGRERF